MSASELLIRCEPPDDRLAIRQIHLAAFPTPAEADLVDNLRAAGNLTISLLAVRDGEAVGHAALSPVTIADQPCAGLGLAPVAVLPAHERQGIASALIRAALSACRKRQIGFVVVLGSPKLYGRCGFQPASRWRLDDEYGGGDAFQAIELSLGALPAAGGLVRYSPEFAVFAP